MKLLLSVKGFFDRVEVAVDLAGDVALQAAHDLSFALAFGGATLDVAPGSWVFAHADEHDAPERFVGLAVAARVQSFPHDLAG